MGRVILCSSKTADIPYRIPVSGVLVYSIEELCYYIYHNIYEITPEYFDMRLVRWLREELDMKVIAGKLETMLEINSDLKDIVISILCSCDYYTEDEIKALLVVMSRTMELPFHGKQKQKADMYLRYGRYTLAKKEYDRIISGGYAVNLTPKEYGDILHNRAMACFFLGMQSDAISDLKDAYSRNNDSRTLRQYLFSLLISGRYEDYKKEIQNYQIDEQVSEGIMTLYNNARARARSLAEYTEIDKIRRFASDYEIKEYATHKIGNWKRRYREGTY